MTFNFIQQMTTLEGPCAGCGEHVVKRLSVQTAKKLKRLTHDSWACKRKAAAKARHRK